MSRDELFQSAKFLLGLRIELGFAEGRLGLWLGLAFVSWPTLFRAYAF